MELIFLWLLFQSPVPPGGLFPAFGALAAAFLFYFGAVKSLPGRPAGMILLFALAFRFTLFFVPPFASDDIYRYVWDGRVQNAGINPYLYAPSAPELQFLRDKNYPGINHKPIRTIYPPLSEMVFRAAARLKPETWVQKLAFLIFDCSVVGLLVFYLKQRGRPLSWSLVYAWNPLVLLEFSSSGHNDSMGIFFLMLGICWVERNKLNWGLSALAASFLSKFMSILLLPWMFVRSAFRKSLWVFIGVSILGYLPYMQGFAPAKRALALFEGPVQYAKDWYFNAGLYALVSKACNCGLTAKGILFGALLVAAFWLAARIDDLLAYAGIMIAGALFISPVVHPWYVCWLVPFLCFYPLWSGLLWTGLVCLSYVVLSCYLSHHVWELPLWVPWAEYGIVFLVLGYESFHCHSRV